METAVQMEQQRFFVGSEHKQVRSVGVTTQSTTSIHTIEVTKMRFACDVQTYCRPRTHHKGFQSDLHKIRQHEAGDYERLAGLGMKSSQHKSKAFDAAITTDGHGDSNKRPRRAKRKVRDISALISKEEGLRLMKPAPELASSYAYPVNCFYNNCCSLSYGCKHLHCSHSSSVAHQQPLLGDTAPEHSCACGRTDAAGCAAASRKQSAGCSSVQCPGCSNRNQQPQQCYCYAPQPCCCTQHPCSKKSERKRSCSRRRTDLQTDVFHIKTDRSGESSSSDARSNSKCNSTRRHFSLDEKQWKQLQGQGQQDKNKKKKQPDQRRQQQQDCKQTRSQKRQSIPEHKQQRQPDQQQQQQQQQLTRCRSRSVSAGNKKDIAGLQPTSNALQERQFSRPDNDETTICKCRKESLEVSSTSVDSLLARYHISSRERLFRETIDQLQEAAHQATMSFGKESDNSCTCGINCTTQTDPNLMKQSIQQCQRNDHYPKPEYTCLGRKQERWDKMCAELRAMFEQLEPCSAICQTTSESGVSEGHEDSELANKSISNVILPARDCLVTTKVESMFSFGELRCCDQMDCLPRSSLLLENTTNRNYLEDPRYAADEVQSAIEAARCTSTSINLSTSFKANEKPYQAAHHQSSSSQETKESHESECSCQGDEQKATAVTEDRSRPEKTVHGDANKCEVIEQAVSALSALKLCLIPLIEQLSEEKKRQPLQDSNDKAEQNLQQQSQRLATCNMRQLLSQSGFLALDLTAKPTGTQCCCTNLNKKKLATIPRTKSKNDNSKYASPAVLNSTSIYSQLQSQVQKQLETFADIGETETNELPLCICNISNIVQGKTSTSFKDTSSRVATVSTERQQLVTRTLHATRNPHISAAHSQLPGSEDDSYEYMKRRIKEFERICDEHITDLDMVKTGATSEPTSKNLVPYDTESSLWSQEVIRASIGLPETANRRKSNDVATIRARTANRYSVASSSRKVDSLLCYKQKTLETECAAKIEQAPPAILDKYPCIETPFDNCNCNLLRPSSSAQQDGTSKFRQQPQQQLQPIIERIICPYFTQPTEDIPTTTATLQTRIEQSSASECSCISDTDELAKNTALNHTELCCDCSLEDCTCNLMHSSDIKLEPKSATVSEHYLLQSDPHQTKSQSQTFSSSDVFHSCTCSIEKCICELIHTPYVKQERQPLSEQQQQQQQQPKSQSHTVTVEGMFRRCTCTIENCICKSQRSAEGKSGPPQLQRQSQLGLELKTQEKNCLCIDYLDNEQVNQFEQLKTSTSYDNEESPYTKALLEPLTDTGTGTGTRSINDFNVAASYDDEELLCAHDYSIPCRCNYVTGNNRLQTDLLFVENEDDKVYEFANGDRLPMFNGCPCMIGQYILLSAIVLKINPHNLDLIEKHLRSKFQRCKSSESPYSK